MSFPREKAKMGVQLVICPKCSKAFPIEEIDAHVLTHLKAESTPTSEGTRQAGA